MVRYHSALRAFDLKALEQLIHLPCALQTVAGEYLIETPFQLRRDMTNLKTRFANKGVVHIHREIDLVHHTGVYEGIVATRSDAFDAKGKKRATWITSYLLKHRTIDGWKIHKINGVDQERAWDGTLCNKHQAAALSSLS